MNTLFEPSERAEDYRQRLLAFMDENIYPNESVYEEQMRELEAARKAAQRKAAAVAAQAVAFAPAATTERRGDLLADLRGAGNLRRAIVLREVLGPPVGLR